jgi:hypothetical protein
MIYVEIDNALFTYDGMSLEDVTNMLSEQNLVFAVIDKETYLKKLEALTEN